MSEVLYFKQMLIDILKLDSESGKQTSLSFKTDSQKVTLTPHLLITNLQSFTHKYKEKKSMTKTEVMNY